MQCPRCQGDNKPGRKFCAACGQALALPCPQCAFVNDPLDRFCGGCGQALAPAPTPMDLGKPSPRSSIPTHFAEGLVQVTSLGPVPVKGLSAPVEVFELVGAGPIRRRLQAAAARGLTRFVGRQTELEALHQALERASAGHGQVIAVVGEPGVGKSRLFWEFTHSYRLQGWLLLESGSVSYGKATPYLPVIDLLKAYCKIHDRDEPREIREKVTGKLLTLDRALEPTLPVFLALLDVPLEDPQWQVLDSPQRRQRTLDALKRLLLRESQVQPLVLIFEDLHWIDAETQVMLDSVVESLPTARVLLLINYRPEYQHGWGSRTYYTQLRLDPLSQANAEELLQALLGDGTALQLLRQLLIERTDGNPFFLEENVRTLIETQVLVGERGAYRLAKDVRTIHVPATVQAVLAARIDRLPLEEKRLLQTAAVIGNDMLFALLQAIAEAPEEVLHRGLAHLQAAEFLYETNLFPELEYTFKHALTHEVAYGSLLQERRRALHARIVAALEALVGDRLAEQIERLAHHAFRGEMWEKAVAYCRQAGAKAAAHSADREAVAYFELALGALAHLPESRDTLEQAIDLRFDLWTSLFPLAEFAQVLDRLREAESLAATLGDRRRLGQVSACLGQYFYQMGDHERALASADRAHAIAVALGDFSLQVTSTIYLGVAYHDLGHYGRAIDCLREAMKSLEGKPFGERFGGIIPAAVISRVRLCWSLAEIGAFAEGIARGEESVEIAEAIDHPSSCVAAYLRVGVLYLLKGDLHQAIPVLERGLTLCQVANLRIWPSQVASVLAAAYAQSGRVAEAMPLLEQALEQPTSMQNLLYPAMWLPWLSEAALLAGRIDQAIQLAEQALALAGERQERGRQAYALRLLGEIAAQRDPPEVKQAEEYYRQAFSLAEELRMRPLQAHCHLGLGLLYRRIGRVEQARSELSVAIELLRSMEMTFWLFRAEAALAEVDKLGLRGRGSR